MIKSTIVLVLQCHYHTSPIIWKICEGISTDNLDPSILLEPSLSQAACQQFEVQKFSANDFEWKSHPPASQDVKSSKLA